MFNEPTATLTTTNVDYLSKNVKETRVGQRVGDTSISQETIMVGFDLDSYLPDRDGEIFIDNWENTWLGINRYEQITE
jgi:hypothetical protein